MTEEDKKSMSLSVTAGITPPPTGGPSGGVTWTGGMEQSIARTMNESISRGEIYADTNNYTYTPEQMQPLNIFAIWRFVATTKLINGTMITISTNEFTCTSDANPPMYLPGSSRDKGTCTGSLAKQATGAVRPVAPLAVAPQVEPTAVDPAKGYVLRYDGRIVSGPKAATFTLQQAQDNCASSRQRYPNVTVGCTFNGNAL